MVIQPVSDDTKLLQQILSFLYISFFKIELLIYLYLSMFLSIVFVNVVGIRDQFSYAAIAFVQSNCFHT